MISMVWKNKYSNAIPKTTGRGASARSIPTNSEAVMLAKVSQIDFRLTSFLSV